jgi:hypothetical protein
MAHYVTGMGPWTERPLPEVVCVAYPPIGRDDARGVFALRGALEWARRADLAVGLLDLRTSADTAGDSCRVVGYGAFALTRSPGAG